MTVRAALEAAYWEHWRKALRDNPRDGLPAYLDALEKIIGGQAGAMSLPGELTEEDLADIRARYEAKKHGAPEPLPAKTPPVPVSGQPPKAPPATRTATRRRRTT